MMSADLILRNDRIAKLDRANLTATAMPIERAVLPRSGRASGLDRQPVN